MKRIFAEEMFDDQPLQCNDCAWKGKGSDANIIDLYGLTDYREVHCPECDSFLGNLKRGGTTDTESAD